MSIISGHVCDLVQNELLVAVQSHGNEQALPGVLGNDGPLMNVSQVIREGDMELMLKVMSKMSKVKSANTLSPLFPIAEIARLALAESNKRNESQESLTFRASVNAVQANLSSEIQMEFTAENQTFIVNSYLRTARFIGGLYRYNLRVSVDEFLLVYPQLQQISRETLCEGFTVLSRLKDLGMASICGANLL
ncbi:hypothetical protein C0J52_17920 [Blattella germanica]|nr:hypothetical protein C0J52_17920 [Blattella germanica]